MRSLTFIAFLILAAAAASGLYFRSLQRPAIPPHLIGHPVEFIPNFLSQDVADELWELIKRMETFPSNANDGQFYKVRHEHIGEAIPMVDGRCTHPFLVPNLNRTHCILPGRVDIGRHYVMTGGVEGQKELYEDLVSRVQSFGRYMFNLTEYPEVQRLFESESFQAASKKTCPPNKQYLDPFQFNFIMQVPGQTVAMHVDAVYFWGATRFQFPQWLLAVMQFSGLFQKEFVDQIQVVGYLHRWGKEQARNVNDGAFVYWDDSTGMKTVPATPLLGNVVDGSKIVHAAAVYRGDVKAPRLDKNKKNELRYLKNEDHWALQVGGETVKNYSNSDLRISIVYRARCFKDAEEATRFRSLPDEETMTLDGLLTKLKAEMVNRGAISAEAVAALPPLDLAMKLLDVFVRYPYPPAALIPLNYCALSGIYPALAPALKYLCN